VAGGRLRKGRLTYRFPPDKRFDAVGCGLSCVDHLCVVKRHPRLDSKQPLVAYDRQPGGPVPTALVALQRWGLRTAYIGTFGDDAGGAMVRAALADEGIDLSACVARPQTRQQVAVILVDEASGERSVLWEQVPELRLRADEVPLSTFAAGRLLLMDAVDVPTAIDAARTAKHEGVLTVLDTDTLAPRTDELLRLTDVLIVSAEFAARLTGSSDVRRALKHMAARGPWFVAVTLGSGGVLAAVHGESCHIPAFPVAVVDTTGAGDIFHAGCLFGLLQGWPVVDSLRFAAAAAALKCEQLGGRPGIPTLERAMARACSK